MTRHELGPERVVSGVRPTPLLADMVRAHPVLMRNRLTWTSAFGSAARLS